MTDTYVSKRANRAEQKRNAEQRRMRVAAQLLAKTPQREIAANEGVALGTISDDILKIRGDWKRRTMAAFDAHVSEEVAKCDWLERAVMPKALLGDGPSVDRVLKIMERRARILGLDAPTRHRVEVITEDAVDAEIRRLQGELAGNDAPAAT